MKINWKREFVKLQQAHDEALSLWRKDRRKIRDLKKEIRTLKEVIK